MKRILIILTVLTCQAMVFGQGWQSLLTDSLDVYSACNDYDGGYLIAGMKNGNTYAASIIKTDKRGIKQWSKQYADLQLIYDYSARIIQSPDSLFLLYGVNNANIFTLKKLDRKGNALWTKKIPIDYAVLKPNKNEYILTGKSRNFSTEVMLRLNLNGDTISQTFIGGIRPADFEVQKDGLFCINGPDNTTVKLNFKGQVIWRKSYPLSIPGALPGESQVIQTPDSTLYVSHRTTYLSKNQKNGDTIWLSRENNFLSARIGFGEFVAAENGIIGMSRDPGLNWLNTVKFDKNGKVVWQKTFNFFTTSNAMKSIIRCTNGGYLMVGNYDTDNTNKNTPFLIKIDDDGALYSNILTGKVVKDLDRNCQITNTDTPFKSCAVEAIRNATGDSYWASTDSLGRYSFNIDSGSYTVKTHIFQNERYWQSCTPSVSKTLLGSKKVDTLDFALSSTSSCASLVVDVSTSIVRHCFITPYFVNYCNNGTVKADNAYINVTLDSLLEYVSASKPVASITGRTYRFNIGTLAVEDCGNFSIETRVRCGDSTRIGQTLCVEAKILPDTLCIPVPLWSGANLVVTGTCQKDSVLFQIKNIGAAPSAIRNSIVIEDEVLFLKTPVQLPSNAVFTKKFPANGRTWRMTVDQEPNHPTSTNPTAFVEGCRANSSLPFDTGFATKFPNDDKDLTIDLNCQQLRGAFDPNEKIGYPTGYKSEHFVAQNQDIEYTVGFQNTGNDTAFTIVVRDTISDKLDISSIEFGASSHIYTPEIYGKSIVKFTFNNIKLVDSFKNEPKSHGFVKYRIKQKKDLPWGTKIFNSAGIYFDFNDPIITNTTLHTVGGKEVISAIIEKNAAADFPVKISPNPFSEMAIFETPLSINGDFELFDMAGKVLRKERFEGTRFEFHRKDLTAGIYLFKISEGGRPLSIGKLIVQ